MMGDNSVMSQQVTSWRYEWKCFQLFALNANFDESWLLALCLHKVFPMLIITWNDYKLEAQSSASNVPTCASQCFPILLIWRSAGFTLP